MILIKHHLSTLIVISLTIVASSCTSKIAFKSLETPDGINYLNISGYLIKPEGTGPFPAIVMLHHCSGLDNDGFFAWAHELKELGYVSFLVDSFGPRGIINVCKSGTMSPGVRASDAHAAKLYLEKLSFVDSENIAVMGWSHGAFGAIWALQDPNHIFPGRPFKAAVAYYPCCKSLIDLNAPLLILIGAEDDWTPAYPCKELIPRNSHHEIILKIYPKTYHGFFFWIEPQIYFGHKIEYNPRATKDSKKRTIQFLQKHLNR